MTEIHSFVIAPFLTAILVIIVPDFLSFSTQVHVLVFTLVFIVLFLCCLPPSLLPLREVKSLLATTSSISSYTKLVDLPDILVSVTLLSTQRYACGH